MRVISKRQLREFWGRHSDAQPALKVWYRIACAADWKNYSDVKRTFNAVDKYKQLYIFNIAGNKYRLVAKIEFSIKIVFIGVVMTHREYDKGKWKDLV